MEWTECLRRSISYMEEHLTDTLDITDIANAIPMSPFYFQKGFKVMTGLTPGEYIRNRRLYLAAMELLAGQCKVIDAALKYGYETPESFTRAFVRFHGCSPTQLKHNPHLLAPYLPLKITISITGGNTMDYTVEKMNAFQVIGEKRTFQYDSAYGEIPKFWGEFMGSCDAKSSTSPFMTAVEKNKIGEFGICIDSPTEDKGFHYMIAGTYQGGPVPEGLELYDIPALTWAKFKCQGPMPGALQSVNTKIFQEWLPGNDKYQIAEPINLEWYSFGDTTSLDYESAIWIPVKEK